MIRALLYGYIGAALAVVLVAFTVIASSVSKPRGRKGV